MKPLILHHAPLILEKIHTKLKMLAAINIRSHDLVICAIEEYLAEEFDGLPFCDVAAGLYEYAVVFREEEVEVRSQILRY